MRMVYYYKICGIKTSIRSCLRMTNKRKPLHGLCYLAAAEALLDDGTYRAELAW